jgi:hypothetical protein
MRCKKNDLAFINKALRPENVGRVVTCSEYLGFFIEGEIIIDQVLVAHYTDHWWQVTSDSNSIETQYGKSNIAYLPDAWLTPIKPEPLDEDDVTDLDLNLALVDENGLSA